MSRSRLAFLSMACATLASISSVFAQETPGKPNQPTPIKPGQLNDNPSQTGQALDDITRQSDQVPGSPRTASPNQATSPSGQRTVQSSTAEHDAPPVTVQQAIIKKLTKANDAEIELAQLAQQKTDNQELRQLAQMLIQDHQAFNQQLEKVGQKAQANQPSGRQAGQSSTSSQSGSMNAATVPHQLCQVMEQACKNSLKMTKEMLQKQEGQDFQMAYLGQQCFAHTMMLAELKAIESDGPQELQQLATGASVKVENHLKHVKQLAEKMKDSNSK
jgi:predicted outer membrane protein